MTVQFQAVLASNFSIDMAKKKKKRLEVKAQELWES